LARLGRGFVVLGVAARRLWANSSLPNDTGLRTGFSPYELTLGPQSQNLKIGNIVELVVGYADMTTPLHDNFYIIRNDCLEAIWPILGRGKLQGDRQ